MTNRGKFVLTLLILGLAAFGTWRWWSRLAPRSTAPASPVAVEPAQSPASKPVIPASGPSLPKDAPTDSNLASPEVAEIGIAYGTEKQRWMEWAIEEFAKSPYGRSVHVHLIPMGSIEAAQAIVAGDSRIHVWSPASSLYRENFSQAFELKHNRKPVAKEEQLALTPMVFVSWKERMGSFKQKYSNLTFTTLSQALKEKGGWAAIAQKPEWGFVKFGHTHPNQSNSGLMALILMAYDHLDKDRNLTLADILNTGFQSWMIDLESSVVEFPNSTGNMMKDMVLKGPSTYDVVLVYESVAIDYLKNAEGRWGQLHVTYPRKNLWSDNPYYILNVPWSEKKHRRAAEAFLSFLMSEPAQKVALAHGFRPGNPSVPILFPESPFQQYQKYGLAVDLPSVCELPNPEVIHNLIVGWNNTVRKK